MVVEWVGKGKNGAVDGGRRENEENAACGWRSGDEEPN